MMLSHAEPPSDASTIDGIGRSIRAGERTCVEVVESCLERIERFEPQIHAWVSVDRDGAIERARRLDAELAAGTDRGPLHGVPVGIKDIIDVAGFPTAAGAEWLVDGPRAKRDATVVLRLRQAGAVILGKTVTTQFAGFDPPPTRNPWNPQRTPGGSSSGSAAAVACGMCPAAVGTQTGGSITRPSSFCGVAGLKPSFGRVSTRGVIPVAWSLDHVGPIARSVRDLAVLFDAMSRTATRTLAASGSLSTTAVALDEPLASPPRIGRLRGPFDDRADEEMQSAVEAAIAAFRAAGAAVTDVELPGDFDELIARHRTIMAVEAAAWHRERFARDADDYLPALRSLIEEGLATRATDYAEARRHQAQMRRSVRGCFSRADVLVGPAATGAAPERATTGDPQFNSPFSYTGLPTVTFPVALSAGNLPLALQLVGGKLTEERLLRTACRLLSAVPHPMLSVSPAID